MFATMTCRRAYDHRMRDLVCEERDPGLFKNLGVPRSTSASWIRRCPRPVVSAEVLALDHAQLQAEVLALRQRVRFLLAIIRLAFLLVRLSGFRLDSKRVPDSSGCSTEPEPTCTRYSTISAGGFSLGTSSCALNHRPPASFSPRLPRI